MKKRLTEPSFFKISIILFVVGMGMLTSCREKNKDLLPLTLDIKRYKLLPFDSEDPIVVVTLLHVYRSYNFQKNKLRSANLYVCRKSDSKDSIFVFDVDNPTSSPYLDKKFEKKGFIVNKRNIKNYPLNTIQIFIPKNFIVPASMEYVFGRIDQTFD